MPHDKKRWMIERGEWRATAPGNGKHAGFHIWAAYSYSPNAAWGTLAIEFLEAKPDAESLKTFINTVLGELWEESYTAKVGADTLQSRVENYEPNVAPARALCLTAGVDVQDNRLSISIYGWGREEESWVVSRVELYGDPSQKELWKQLDSVLLTPYRHELGGELTIAATCVDSGGHFTHEVYQYCRERRKHHILAVKGASQRAKPAIGKPTKQDVNFRGQTVKFGVDLYPVGTDTIKSVIYGRLKHNEPGPGYIHFHGELPIEFFDQLTVEKQVVRTVKGFPVRDWVKPPGKRNEAFDEAVYAFAALQSLYSRFHRSRIWDQFERALGVRGERVPSPIPPPDSGADGQDNAPTRTETALKKQRAARKMNPTRRGGGFISRW